jgi:hypothetical protein
VTVHLTPLPQNRQLVASSNFLARRFPAGRWPGKDEIAYSTGMELFNDVTNYHEVNTGFCVSRVEIVWVSAYSIAVRRVSCEGLREAKQWREHRVSLQFPGDRIGGQQC